MQGNQIRFQGVVWTFGEREFATLLMDGHSVSEGNRVPDALLRASQSRGLPLTTDIRRVPLKPVPGWQIEVTFEESALGPRPRLTVRWPHVRPLVSHAGVDLPQRWQELAVTQRVGLLLVGCDLVTDNAPARDGDLPSRIARLAVSGALTAGVVAFRSGNRVRPQTYVIHQDRRKTRIFLR
ncbi:hypothetical protein [Amycolatopsis sp. NPDC051071]|uniref:hypothetical protein n=1 Tax=Amycolatopsis sp. NPDC051071 TaxID=3154637 RepID=UPI0034226BEC